MLMCRIYSLQTWCDSIGEFRLIDRYGLHLKVIHNDVTDRLAQLLKQCSYYLQQQQKPMEVSIGIVFMYICKYHVTLLLNFFNVNIRIRFTRVSLYWFYCLILKITMYMLYLFVFAPSFFPHVLHILYRLHVFHFFI